MEPDGQLPATEQFEHLSNVTHGLGNWGEWEDKQKQPGFIDPYYEWLAELKPNPELAYEQLDKINRDKDIEPEHPKQPWLNKK